MINFARRYVIFLGGLCAMLVLASIYYEVRVRQTGLLLRQVEWFSNPDVEPVVVFIGDSRMATNLDPGLLPPGYYNWSYPAETLRHMYLRTKSALRAKPSIRYLVVGVEDLTLSEPRARLREATEQMIFANLVDLTEVYPPSPRFLLRSAALHYLPLINATNRRHLGEALGKDINYLATGTRPQETLTLSCGALRFTLDRGWSKMGKEARDLEVSDDVDKLLGEENDVPAMRDLFLRFLRLAEDHGVKVIGVQSPLARPYIAAAERYDTESVKNFYRSLPLVALLDYEKNYADRLDYFINGDHLNERGARAYTERLVNDLQRIIEPASDARAPCDLANPAPALRWPYNDVISEWLRTPACRNLRGECGVLRPPVQIREAPPEPPQGTDLEARYESVPTLPGDKYVARHVR